VSRGVINEVADEKGCSSVLFFEARKRQDLYLWMVRQAEAMGGGRRRQVVARGTRQASQGTQGLRRRQVQDTADCSRSGSGSSLLFRALV
jgi:hypothetical protein